MADDPRERRCVSRCHNGTCHWQERGCLGSQAQAGFKFKFIRVVCIVPVTVTMTRLDTLWRIRSLVRLARGVKLQVDISESMICRVKSGCTVPATLWWQWDRLWSQIPLKILFAAPISTKSRNSNSSIRIPKSRFEFVQRDTQEWEFLGCQGGFLSRECTSLSIFIGCWATKVCARQQGKHSVASSLWEEIGNFIPPSSESTSDSTLVSPKMASALGLDSKIIDR